MRAPTVLVGVQELIFERMSEQRPKQIPGNVVLTLKQKRHALFRRDGNHLHMDLTISLKEALLGFERKQTHLDGHEFVIRSAPGRVTKPAEVLTLKGEGMPVHNFPSEFGDLKVTITVDFPPTLTEEQAAALTEHF